MNLLLCSQGLTTPAIAAEFLSLAGIFHNRLRVGYIATAGEVEKDRTYQMEERAGLAKIGVSVIDLDLKDPACCQRLNAIDALFVGGGNTFYLLFWMRRSGIAQRIVERARDGMLYAGVSAGSIVAGSSIVTATWKGMDDPSVVDLESLDGLNLFNGLIFPHYSERWEALVTEESKTVSNRLYCLNDLQALSISDGSVRLIG